MSDATHAERRKLCLFGNPNSGKTTLFNRLTGARARVGNYPGVTVERREGSLRLPNGEEVEVLDLPGTYSLAPRSPDEAIASAALFEGDTDSVWVVVVDANALARTLYLATLVAETDVPLVVALNMVDEVEGRGGRVDVGPVERALGVRCVPIVASKGEGVDALLEAVIAAKPRSPLALPALGPAAGPLARVADGVASAFPSVRAGLVPGLARRFVLATDAELGELPDAIARPTREAIDAGAGEALVRVRYALVDDLTARTVDLPATTRSASERIDDVLTHPWLGTGIFLVVMGLIFEGLFVGAEPVVSVIERAVSAVGGFVAGVMPEGPLEGLVVDGVIAGVGNVVTFVPQIALLFLLLGVLEDSGYLARVAFVLDRLMGAVGLNGRAFVPMISGYACAIPAVMATRTIENAKDRILTMLVIPLMSCSARLPIYVLVTAAVFSGTKPVFGFIAVGAVVLLAMYTLSLVAAVGAAAVLRRTVLRGPRPTLMLELPPYRWPTGRNLAFGVWRRVRVFLTDAGSLILALSIILWALLSYPRDGAAHARFESAREQAETMLAGPALDARMHQLQDLEAQHGLEHSVAGRVGRAMEPALRPLGMDWRVGVGVLGAFAAREVFISTLGTVFGIGDADETSAPLRDVLTRAKRDDGSKLFTPLSGVALMVFFVLACQCMSTLAVVRRESGSWKWPVFLFGYMSVLAYVGALLVYQAGLAMGFS